MDLQYPKYHNKYLMHFLLSAVFRNDLKTEKADILELTYSFDFLVRRFFELDIYHQMQG